MMTPVHVTCIIRCLHLYQKQQSPQTPSRRSPRASDPHTGHVIIRFHSSPIQSPSSKNLDIGFDETSVRSPQISNQPCQANTLNLRYCQANQSPTGSSKSHALQSTQTKHRPVPANATDLRLVGAVTSCTYGHGHTCTDMRTVMVTRTPALACAHLHGHVHTFTGYVHGHAFDETSVRLTQIKRQSNSLKCPAAASLRGSTRPTCLLKYPEPVSHLRRSTIQPAYSKYLGGMGMASTTTLRRLRRPDVRWGGASTCVSPA